MGMIPVTIKIYSLCYHAIGCLHYLKKQYKILGDLKFYLLYLILIITKFNKNNYIFINLLLNI